MNLFMQDFDEIDYIDEKEIKYNKKRKANVKLAEKMLNLLDDTFDTYIKEQLKKLDIVPYISRNEFDITKIETKNFKSAEKLRIYRKLMILQQIYIDGIPKEEYDEDYLTNKTFTNDRASLIQDLSILLCGVDGLNYRIIEKKGLDIDIEYFERG